MTAAMLLLLVVANDWVTTEPGAMRSIALHPQPPLGAPPIEGARYAQMAMGGRRLLVVEIGGAMRIDGHQVRDGAVELLLAVGPGGATLRVPLEVELGSDAFSYRHALARRGEIVLEERSRPFVLVDGNQDLRFDDARHDRVRLDVDGDGELESFSLDEEFACGGGRYRFSRGDPTGNTLGFERRGDAESHASEDRKSIRAQLDSAVGADEAERERLRRSLRLLRRKQSVAVLLSRLRDPKQLEFTLSVLRDVPTPEVAAALLKLRRRGRATAAIDEALLGQDDPRVTRELRRDLAKGTLSDRRDKLRALFSVGLGHNAIAAVALDLLADRDWKWRALALLELRDSTAPMPPRIARRVLGALRDESWPVRLAAAESLARARLRDVVLPMIEGLERDRNERIRQALGLSLYRITGVHLGSWPPSWRRWWERDGGSFVVPLDAPPRNPPRKKKKNTGERRSVSRFYGIRIGSSRVVFLIDASGSMAIEDRKGARSRFDVAMEELERAFRGLPNGARANVIFFSDTVWSWKPRITPLTGSMRRSIRKQVGARSPRGGTHMYDGFEAAFRDKDVDTIVLLSDGQPSGGKIQWPDEIEKAILDWNALRRLTIHCVAVGYHSPMLRRLAEASGGQYLRK